MTDATDATATDPHADADTGPRLTYEVPDGDATVECEYCGRPFASDSLRRLHLGRAHRDALSEEELASFEETYEAETAAIRRFRLKALALLIALYFGVLMVYAVVL